MRTRERIRKDYYERWLRSPIRVEPETKMPTYFTGENSVLPTVLDGKADQQIDALWNYLLQGDGDRAAGALNQGRPEAGVERFASGLNRRAGGGRVRPSHR